MIFSELMICRFSRVCLAFSMVMSGRGLLCASLEDVSMGARAGDGPGVPLGRRLLAVLRAAAVADAATPREDMVLQESNVCERLQIVDILSKNQRKKGETRSRPLCFS